MHSIMKYLQFVCILPLASGSALIRHHPLAFAGGFGAKPQQLGGKKKSKGKRKRTGFSEIEPINKPATNVVQPVPADDDSPKLDKWGLPPPTEDELFPPLPPGTELITAPSDPSQVSLSSIHDALKEHITLDLKRFNDGCVETNPLAGRDPMKLRFLHTSPPVLEIQNFFTEEECEAVRDVAVPPRKKQNDDGENNNRDALQVDSATFSALATSKRTSTSWFCHYAQMPTLLAKAYHMLGIPIEQMEEPQIVRYRPGEEFSWHYDEIPATELENGGQRVATLLAYLSNVEIGGGTIFRYLKSSDGKQQLTMKPQIGSALLFFPAFADGRADDRTLHKGEVVEGDTTKWITQVWIHQRAYKPVTPPGNSQEAAMSAVERVSDSLQYTGNK
mmetsp:Transcript_21060/g.34847  ORF Transcript_21060/g.34847 Transcript_21060/m.34847 type:complete len:389 (+) Transcript_21060:81-1247(+)